MQNKEKDAQNKKEKFLPITAQKATEVHFYSFLRNKEASITFARALKGLDIDGCVLTDQPTNQ